MDLAESPALDPFTSPRLNAAYSPAIPEPAVQKATFPQSGRTAASKDVLYASHNQYSRDGDESTEKSASMSSAGKDSLLRLPSYSTDTGRKGATRKSDRQAYSRTVMDPEKAKFSPNELRDHLRGLPAGAVASTDGYEEEELRQIQAANALKILLFLCGPCVILSVLNATWALVALLVALFSQPVRLCAQRPSFGQQLSGLLAPALNLQLRCIYSPLPPHADENKIYRSVVLVAVQLLSPFLSVGMALAGWVVATFWISSLVVGDPSGTDKHDDGSETALLLVRFWERWLRRSFRQA